MDAMTTYTGWHFLADPTQLANDGGPVPSVGESVSIDGEPIPCKRGFHASKRALDALNYAPGPWLERIRLEGIVIVGDDKAVGSRRVSLSAPVNIERELRLWVCDEVERVLPIYERRYPGDERPRRAIEVARRFAVGHATPGELAAARTAAWAARDAAWVAGTAGTAWADAWAAAGTAAWAAAGTAGAASWAAGDAAWVAGTAAWAAEHARQERELAALFRKATK